MLQEIQPGVGFETGDFVKEKLGGLPQNDSMSFSLFNTRVGFSWGGDNDGVIAARWVGFGTLGASIQAVRKRGC